MGPAPGLALNGHCDSCRGNDPIENPYQPSTYQSSRVATPPPEVGAGGERLGRVRAVVWFLVFAYPVLLVASFYGCWLVAAIALGHPPRPSLDDPKSIGGLMAFVYIIPGILLLGLPVMFCVGCCASLFCPFPVRSGWRLPRNLSLACIYIVLNVSAIWFLRADPLRVVEWWFD